MQSERDPGSEGKIEDCVERETKHFYVKKIR